jgi:hypothetical protein
MSYVITFAETARRVGKIKDIMVWACGMHKLQ